MPAPRCRPTGPSSRTISAGTDPPRRAMRGARRGRQRVHARARRREDADAVPARFEAPVARREVQIEIDHVRAGAEAHSKRRRSAFDRASIDERADVHVAPDRQLQRSRAGRMKRAVHDQRCTRRQAAARAPLHWRDSLPTRARCSARCAAIGRGRRGCSGSTPDTSTIACRHAP